MNGSHLEYTGKYYKRCDPLIITNSKSPTNNQTSARLSLFNARLDFIILLDSSFSPNQSGYLVNPVDCLPSFLHEDSGGEPALPYSCQLRALEP